MKLSTRIIAAVLLIAGSSGAVYAYGKHNGWHMSPEEKVEFVTDRVSKKLELDSQQRQYFTDLASQVASMMQEARASRKQQMAEISGLLTDANFDQARALELVQQKTRVINDKAPEVIASLGLFVDSLNAEQKQKLGEFVRHRQEHRRHRGQDHGHRELQQDG